MRKTLITFGALALFTASPVFALDQMGTIGNDDEVVSLATGGGAGTADGGTGGDTRSQVIGEDDQAFRAGVNLGDGAPARLLPTLAQDGMRTIGDDDDAFSATGAGG